MAYFIHSSQSALQRKTV